MISAADKLRDASETFKERGGVYRDNHERLAGMLAALFPDGIELTTSEDHARFVLLSLVLVKLTRYAVQWPDAHNDSIDDAIVYLAMLGARDANNRNNGEHGQREDMRPGAAAPSADVAQ
jgi:hypothetical protein